MCFFRAPGFCESTALIEVRPEKIYENKFSIFSLTAGIFSIPFGYEVELSSSGFVMRKPNCKNIL